MKIYFKYAFALMLVTALGGCKKYLDLQPLDGIIKQEFWKTKEQVKASVIGIYSSMMEPSSGAYGRQDYVPSMTELFFVWGECQYPADQCKRQLETLLQDHQFLQYGD
jgi:hypothetical protein